MGRLCRRRRRTSRPTPRGTRSEMTALAQPNQSPVPVGLLAMVQSWTWVKEAAAAMAPMASRIRTSMTPSNRSPAVGLGVVMGRLLVGVEWGEFHDAAAVVAEHGLEADGVVEDEEGVEVL